MDIYLNGSTDSIMSFNDEPHIFENIFVRVGIILVYSSIFLICFFGNLAVILVVSLRWKRRSVSKFCLGNMAVANFSVSVLCVLQNLTLFLVDTWIFGEEMCKMYHFITNLCQVASILMVVLISIERYLVVIHPLRCRQFLTPRKLVVAILAVWILSAVISLPRLFYFGLIPVQLNANGEFGHVCVPIHSMYYSAAVDIINFLIMYLIPLMVMLALYLRIAFFLIRRERLGIDLEEDNASAQDTFTESRLSQSSQKQLDGLNVEQKRPIQVWHSHSIPAYPVMLSMPLNAPTSREQFRGQIPPEETLKNRLNIKELRKWSSHPTVALHFESIQEPGRSAGQDTEVLENVSRRDFIPEEILARVRNITCEVRRYVRGGLLGVTRSSHSTTTLCSSDRRNAEAISAETRRLYRYNRLQLSRIRSKQRQRVNRILIYIVMTFAVLNLPHHLRKLIFHFLPSFDMTAEANTLIAPLTFALMYANCAVNPVLYAFMSKGFRANLREICFGCRRNIVRV